MNPLHTLRTALARPLPQLSLHKTYHFRDHAAIELKVAQALPVHIHIELDAPGRSLVYVDIGKTNWDLAELNLDEAQLGQRAGQRRSQYGLDRVLDDV